MMLWVRPLDVWWDGFAMGGICHSDAIAAAEYGRIVRQYGHAMRAGVSPPVIPPYYREPLMAGEEASGIPGRMEPWVNEQAPFRDSTAGRGYGTRLVDAEMMSMDD